MCDRRATQLLRPSARHPLRLAPRLGLLHVPAGSDGTCQEAHVGGRIGLALGVLLCDLRDPLESQDRGRGEGGHAIVLWVSFGALFVAREQS